MKHIWILLTGSLLFAADAIDCTKVFDERKGELLKEIEKIDEARQSFEALQAATMHCLKSKKVHLKKKRVLWQKQSKKLRQKSKKSLQC